MTAVLVRVVLLLVAAAILALLAAPFALHAEHRTTARVVPALTIGVVVLVGVTLLEVMT